ncbi:MAG TPA: sigma-70 family RNA polymerase sigma factor [Galbitalea sp.]|nr:sigma-70 family RNA polymerase sigma factor [Galbitalea sp.]
MSTTAFERCLADVVADNERQGGISADDVGRLTGVHKLSPDEVALLFEELDSLGVAVDVVQDEKPLDWGAHKSDTLGRMLHGAGRARLLTAEEEVKLGRRIASGQQATEQFTATHAENLKSMIDDGKRAHDSLVLANMRLVVSIARRYHSDGMEMVDLIQEGMIGLMRAADKYDWSLGYKFSTYATWWIRQSVTRALADKGRVIRLPVHFVEHLAQINGERARLAKSLNREATLKEISEGLSMDPGKVQAAMDLAREPVSLDELFPESDTSLAEVLHLYSADIELEVADQITREQVAQALLALDLRLSRRMGAGAQAGEMLRLRYGMVDGRQWTLDEVGAKFGVTRERARQITSKTLKSKEIADLFSKLDPREMSSAP